MRGGLPRTSSTEPCTTETGCKAAPVAGRLNCGSIQIPGLQGSWHEGLSGSREAPQVSPAEILSRALFIRCYLLGTDSEHAAWRIYTRTRKHHRDLRHGGGVVFLLLVVYILV